MEVTKTLKIKNELGLHARAAAKTVALVKQYKSKLVLKRDSQEVDGSSILSILTLACPKGSEIEARIKGEDAQEMMESLSNLFEEKFGEKA